MSFRVNNQRLTNDLDRINADREDSLQKLSSGKVFTQRDPRPAERALAESLENKIRSMSSAKRNLNDGVSLLQTAEGGMNEINNMITRMREITLSGASSTISDKERRFLFLEYQALHDEVNRIAKTTEFNGTPLLDGANEATPENMVFRLGSPYFDENINLDEDLNALKFEGLPELSSSAEGLGLKSAADMLIGSSEDEGITIADVEELLIPDDDGYDTSFDEALGKLSTQRATFGAIQERLNRALNYLDVYSENITAAKSKIADTDYASEVARLTENNILVQATTSMLAQSNFAAGIMFNLLNNLG